MTFEFITHKIILTVIILLNEYLISLFEAVMYYQIINRSYTAD